MEPALDNKSLEFLYRKLEKPLFNVVYRWLWNTEEAKDVVQEAFVRLWAMKEKVDLLTVEPLVYKIALHLASNRRRTKKFWKWVSLEVFWERPALQPSAEQALVVLQQQKMIQAAIDALPEKLRRVIMLCEFSEMRYEEIAQILGIPVGTVASRRNKALKRLQQQLGDFTKEEVEI